MDPQTIKPTVVAFEVTGRCRFECRHCHTQARLGDLEPLSTQACTKILQAVARYHRCTLIFTGGEPLERADLPDLVATAGRLGLRPVLASCGYPITAEVLGQLRAAGLEGLSLSLDGASPETHDVMRQAAGGFAAVERAAVLARDQAVPFQITTTLSRANAGEVIAIAHLAQQWGASSFNPLVLVPTQRQQDIGDLLLDPVEYEMLLNELLQLKRTLSIDMQVTCGPHFDRLIQEQTSAEKRIGINNGCLGGRSYGFINRFGQVQTCGFLNLQAGSLVDNGYDFGAIWEQSRLMQQVRDRHHYTGRCARCTEVNLCGGCRARAFLATGDPLASDPQCPKDEPSP